jgi:hypothetical protein
MRTTRTVAGEDIDEVMLVLSTLDWTEHDDGSWTTQGRWGPEGDAFARAFTRIDAELMLEEAVLIGSPGHRVRTDGQRRGDAFCELAMRIGEAMGRPRHAPPRGIEDRGSRWMTRPTPCRPVSSWSSTLPFGSWKHSRTRCSSSSRVDQHQG